MMRGEGRTTAASGAARMVGRSFVSAVAASWGRNGGGARVAAELGAGRPGRVGKEEGKGQVRLCRGRFDEISGGSLPSDPTWRTHPGVSGPPHIRLIYELDMSGVSVSPDV